MTLNIAVLGAGRIGQVHADTVATLPGARLAAIADPVAEAAQSVASRHGCAISDIDRVEADADIDAVVICTPTDTHADLIERYARAGKAIFCEKPVDLSMARVRDCLAVVEETGAFLMIGFQRRFEPDFQVVRAAIDQGRVGRVEMISLVSRDPSPPPLSYLERAGGIFRDMTIHDFDVARWMMGAPFVSVYATGSVLTDPAIATVGDYDAASVVMRTEAGQHCTISNIRRVSYGYDQRIEVTGSEGAVSALNHAEARVQFADGRGYTVPPNKHSFLDRYLDAYRAGIAAFATAVIAGDPPPVGGADGLEALALADAAILSDKEGREVRVDEVRS